MFGRTPTSFRRWARHTAAVPKGFLRYRVLELLNEKSLSGSEIMDEIERQTGSRWKPSPGSIYPLLAWMQDNGYIKELPATGDGMKRYELTDAGKTLLEDQRKIRTHFGKESMFFGPPFLGALWSHMTPETGAKMRESMRRLVQANVKLVHSLEANFSEQAIAVTLRTLDEASKTIEDLAEKLQKAQNK